MPSRRCVLAAAGAALAWGFPIARPRAQQRPERLVFVFSRGASDPYTRWLSQLYAEALGRLGIRFEFLDVPPNRATAMSAVGLVDGELGRTREFAVLYPSLVRVEEPNNAVLFSAYAVAPLPEIDGWEAVRRSSLTLAFRAGIKEIEEELRRDAYRGRTVAVKEIVSGLRMLQRGRVDLYADVQNAVDPYLVPPGIELDPPPSVLPRLAGVLLRTTGHAYLHERHRALAPELAAVLREMKAEGRHARHLVDALAASAMEGGVPEHRARAEAEAVARAVLSGHRTDGGN